MNGYVQLIQIPPDHLKNLNVLDRMTGAIDGPDPAEVRKEWFDTHKVAFLEWSGLGEDEWRFTHVSGYPSQFMVLSGPWSAKDAPPLPIEEKLVGLLDEIGTGAVYGDTGTSLGGQSFSARARWKVGTKRNTPVAEVSPTWRLLIGVTVLILLLGGLLWLMM